MGWYFDQIKQECEEHDLHWNAENKSKGSMKTILEENSPEEGEVLLVNARTGTERKAFHAWAESKGYTRTIDQNKR